MDRDSELRLRLGISDSPKIVSSKPPISTSRTDTNREQLLKTVAESRPKKTKKSKRDSKRPLVLTQCPEAKKLFLFLK